MILSVLKEKNKQCHSLGNKTRKHHFVLTSWQIGVSDMSGKKWWGGQQGANCSNELTNVSETHSSQTSCSCYAAAELVVILSNLPWATDMDLMTRLKVHTCCWCIYWGSMSVQGWLIFTRCCNTLRNLDLFCSCVFSSSLKCWEECIKRCVLDQLIFFPLAWKLLLIYSPCLPVNIQ